MNRPVTGGVFIAIALLLAAATVSAAAPQPTATTPELLAKARDEKKIVWYTSIELQTAEKIAKEFESAHPGIDVQVERNGCERIVQRIAQERSSNIHAADVVECSDMTALLDWKKQGWLAAYLPEDVATYPADYRDPDGFYATDRITLSPILYNTKLVKPEEAPKSFADLLDPKWKGKLAEHLSVYQTFPELWEREAFEEKLDGAPEATGEPGKSSAGELGRLAVRVFFSAGAGLLAWSHMPVETAQ